jgi:hypothetical protein
MLPLAHHPLVVALSAARTGPNNATVARLEMEDMDAARARTATTARVPAATQARMETIGR